jgi:hypothetical protein
MIPPCKSPEPPRIIESDALSTLEDKVEMIVFARCVMHVTNSQGTGHSKVDQQPAGFSQLNQQVFRTPPAAGNSAAPGLEYLARHWPAQVGVSNHQLFDTTTGKSGLYAAQGGFDFRQLRQKRGLASLLLRTKKPAVMAGSVV